MLCVVCLFFVVVRCFLSLVVSYVLDVDGRLLLLLCVVCCLVYVMSYCLLFDFRCLLFVYCLCCCVVASCVVCFVCGLLFAVVV